MTHNASPTKTNAAGVVPFDYSLTQDKTTRTTSVYTVRRWQIHATAVIRTERRRRRYLGCTVLTRAEEAQQDNGW